MKSLIRYRLIIERCIKKIFLKKIYKNIYYPINYILSMKAKRIRSSLCLLSSEMFGRDIYKSLKTSVSLEFFHNFTLIHDDIMDESDFRRGNLSIHKKWDKNTAILSGDLLLIKAYQLLEDLEPNIFYKVVKELSSSGVKVCEGQEIDINIEKNCNYNFKEYIKMIEYKTAELIGSSLKIGAILAGTNDNNIKNLYETGKNIGIVFQIQDDLLDVFGKSEYTGKKKSSDIIKNKKTILYFKAIEKANNKEKEELLYWYNIKTDNNYTYKVNSIKKIFKKLNIKKDIEKDLIKYKKKIFNSFIRINGKKQQKKILIEFINELFIRFNIKNYNF